MANKGHVYEHFAYEYFNSLIKQGYFHFPVTQCRLTKQKPFYSKDREKNIYFDLVLEIFLPNQSDPFLIFVIECKNYNHKVPVDDIEEFASKVDQIRYQKISPICITTVGFQSGGLTFAKNRGITLWRVVQTTSEPEIILNRQKQRSKDLQQVIESALTNEKYNSWQYGNIFIQSPTRFTLYPKEFIYDLLKLEPLKFKTLKNNKLVKKNVPYLSKKQISVLAENLYNKYKNTYGELEIHRILEELDISLEVTKDLFDIDTIAEINFEKKIITLFGKSYFSETQLKFALAHEIGHFVLKHDTHLNKEQQTVDKSINIEVKHELPLNLDRIEYQANYFASCLLLPEKTLTHIFLNLLERHKVKNRGFSLLYIDNQPCNLINYKKICLPIANFFDVSQETLKIRLTELKLAEFHFSKIQQETLPKSNFF